MSAHSIQAVLLHTFRGVSSYDDAFTATAWLKGSCAGGATGGVGGGESDRGVQANAGGDVIACLSSGDRLKASRDNIVNISLNSVTVAILTAFSVCIHFNRKVR